MSIDSIKVEISIKWLTLKNNLGEPYTWGDTKNKTIDPNWSKSNVIYRWIKNSTGEIAVVGETERRITDRVNNYISARPKSYAGQTNKKVFNEQEKLSQNDDKLRLEFTANVSGYNLSNNRERKLAESLLIGYYKPYLQ